MKPDRGGEKMFFGCSHSFVSRSGAWSVLIFRLFLLWFSLANPAAVFAGPLTIGSVSSDPAKDVHIFLPVAKYLAEQLAPLGVDKGRVVVAASVQEMAGFMKSGQVDLYIDSPLPSLEVNRLAGGKMVLRRWKEGKAEYSSVIFVKKDSPIENLSQLSGNLVGFKDPQSSSSHLMPRIAMEQAGLNLVEITEGNGTIPQGKTGYIFSGDRETNVFWVVMGKTVAGAASPEDLDKQAKLDREKLRVIHETSAIPRHVVNVRGDLPEPLVQAVTKNLLEMDQNNAGKRVLEEFEKTTKFDAIPPETLSLLQQVAPFVTAILGGRP